MLTRLLKKLREFFSSLSRMASIRIQHADLLLDYATACYAWRLIVRVEPLPSGLLPAVAGINYR